MTYNMTNWRILRYSVEKFVNISLIELFLLSRAFTKFVKHLGESNCLPLKILTLNWTRKPSAEILFTVKKLIPQIVF
jgi:hypothetical protein